MTQPAEPDQIDAVEQISRLISGNDQLVARPGLVVALQQANATPVQAQAINQFVGGLNAAVKVRNATAAGVKVNLSPVEQQQLDGMGVNYADVVKRVYNPLEALRQQMAKQGLQPKLAADQKTIETDPAGNPKAEPVNWLTDYSNVVGSSQSTSGSALTGPVASEQQASRMAKSDFATLQQDYKSDKAAASPSWLQRTLSSVGDAFAHSGLTRGAQDVGGALTKSWNFVDTNVSQQREMNTNPLGAARAAIQNSEAAQRLGYDPNSWTSMMAFQSQGYSSNDTSKAAESWDTANPNGKFGMDGQQAAVEAQVFLADPQAYEQKIAQDKSLTPEQVADRLKMVNSTDFQDMVRRVAADKNSIGNDVARELNIDPVKHSTLHAVTAFTADTAASFALDPTSLALYGYTGYQHASVAIKNFHDAEGINAILRAGEDGAHVTAAQFRVQRYVHDMVGIGNDFRAAKDAGDEAAMAQAQARANANPYGGLLSDFAGGDQFLRGKTAAEVQAEVDRGVKNVQPFVIGPGEPIDTYDKAAEYLSSKAALFRLGGGKAPVEFSTMPGAVSSYAFNKLKGKLSAWSTGLDVRFTERAAGKLIGRAEADPEVARTLLTNGSLRRVLPTQDDAVDMLTGRVVAARQAVAQGVEGADSELASAQRALADRQMELEGAGPLAVTPQGYGEIRANQLRYGTAAAPTGFLSKGKSIYSLGSLRRAGMIVARVMNQLPRDLTVDVANGADAEAVRRLARTYLTRGDANLLAARWVGGNAETRKAVVQALREQVYHAAGLSRSKAGREFLDQQAAAEEHYAVNGVEVQDSFGRNAAQWPGQVQTEFRLPQFGKVHKLAAKVGLWEGTMGRLLDSNAVDRLNSIWRTGILGTPITAWRATLEALLVAHIDPELGVIRTLATKAVQRETGLMNVKALHRSWAAQAIADTIGFRDVGRLYRSLLKRSLTEDELHALESMPQEMAVNRLIQQTRLHWAQEVDPSNAGEATQIAELGLRPTEVRYDTKEGFNAALRKRTGYEVTDKVNGLAGANAYAFSLGSRVNAAPEVAKAVLDRIEHPDGAGLGTPLHRYSANAAEDVSNPREQGLHFNVQRHGEYSFYDTKGKTKYTARGLPLDHPKVFRPEGEEPDGMVSAGLSSLKALAGNAKYQRLLKMWERGDADSIRAEIAKDFPDAKLGSLHNGGRLLEAYGALLARREGYHAVFVKDSEDAAFDEYLALTPEAFTKQYGLNHVIDALDSERLMNDSLYGRVYRDVDGMQRTALTAEEKAESKRQWAQQLVDDMTHLMVGRNGKYQQKIADYVREHGHSPDADWIQDNIKGMDRPEKMLRPQYAAVIPGLEGKALPEALNQIAESVQNYNGKVYQWAVERLIQRNSTSPLYGLAYAESKTSLAGLKQAYMDAGVAEPAAESIVANVADHQAWQRVAKIVDDPSLKLQMDVAGRSFFAFSRATTMMLRRWGYQMWKNPAQARRLMLAYEGAEHSGFIYQDQNGQPMFLLPLTGVAQEVLFHAMSHIPGMQGMAAYPYQDFEGNVASIIPGSNNPFQYNTTPFVSIGGRFAGDLFPDSREMIDEIDRKLNGEAGQGRGIAETLEPRILGQAITNDVPVLGPNFGGEGRDSVVTSAMVGTLYRLYATGKIPPDGASAAQMQQFYDRLKTGTRSTLFARFLLGTLSPARISVPGDSSKPDFAYAARGVKSMKDEFSQLINDTNGNWARALAIWTSLHPDETVFTQSSSQGLVKDTLLPSTQQAYNWMLNHDSLIKKYGSLAAYFLPPQKPGQAFSMEAYRAQIEEGFRQRKTPQEFLDGVRIAAAGAVYYAQQAAKDDQLAQAQKAGDKATEEAVRKGWSIWSSKFKDQHPTFKQHLTEEASGAAPAMTLYGNLQQMVHDNEVPGNAAEKAAVAGMVKTFDAYQAEMAKYPTNTRADTAAKASMTAAMQQYFDDTLKANPDLTDLYNAVLRPLNERLQYANSPDGS